MNMYITVFLNNNGYLKFTKSDTVNAWINMKEAVGSDYLRPKYLLSCAEVATKTNVSLVDAVDAFIIARKLRNSR